MPNTHLGTNGDDVLLGLAGDDIILPLMGNDSVDGGGGNDTILGGLGNDTLLGGDGQDSLSGEDGNDVLYGNGGNDTLFGQAGDDRFIWNDGDGADTMVGGSGTDTAVVNGATAADDAFAVAAGGSEVLVSGTHLSPVGLNLFLVEALEVNGGGGNDQMVVGTLAGTSLQRLTFDGGSGDDTLDGWAADRALVAHGGSGADVLHGGSAADTLLGEADNDILIGAHGNDLLDGGADQLMWTAGDGSDRIIGGADADTLQIEGGAQTGDLFLLTSAAGHVLLTVPNVGSDALDVSEVETIKISGLGGDDVLSIDDLSATGATKVSFDAGSGDDILDGSRATTAIGGNGEGGNDTLIGGAGNDSLDGGGYDVALGGAGADTLIGGTGDDHLDGGTGADSLTGGTGDDTLDGGDGADTIVGGPGEDLLWGGAGADVFSYISGDLTNGIRESELIVDYSAAQGDTIDLPHGASDVAGASVVNGNLFVTLAGDGDILEVAGVHHLSKRDLRLAGSAKRQPADRAAHSAIERSGSARLLVATATG